VKYFLIFRIPLRSVKASRAVPHPACRQHFETCQNFVEYAFLLCKAYGAIVSSIKTHCEPGTLSLVISLSIWFCQNEPSPRIFSNFCQPSKHHNRKTPTFNAPPSEDAQASDFAQMVDIFIGSFSSHRLIAHQSSDV
jgi:hypothetical protein